MADATFTYGPGNVNQLLTTTLSTYVEKTPVDQIFNKRPFLNRMLKKAKKENGGASIITNVMYEKNSSAQAYDEYDILNTTPQDGLTSTQAKWKNNAVSVSISGVQERKNNSTQRIVSLLETKTQQAMESLQDKVNVQLFQATTGAKDVRSLVTMIDQTSSIQDVNSTTYSWWQSQVTTGGSFATQGLSDMRTLWTTIDKLQPNSMIDTIVTTDTVHNYYEAALTPQTRYTNQANADGSFSGLLFKNAVVFYDAECTSGVMYMFSSDDLYLVIESKANMTSTPFVKPYNQDARVAQIIFTSELVTRARRKLGKITSITA